MSEADADDQNSKVVKIVGTYLVGPTIGKGYFARVKRVEDPYRQVYAMKCFDKERIGRNSHTLKQVEKEINALRLCYHPSIAKFHEVLEVENSVYLIMEYVPHGELFEYIKQKGRLSEPESVYMGKQIISALDYCHRAGIAHRDVKPENVLIDERHNIKLVDFGLCSFYREHNSQTPNVDPTTVGDDQSFEQQSNQPQNAILNTQCGSPHYAAPEVLLGLGYDGPAADIWSFGVLLYAMVTGSLPFTARLIPQLVQKIVAGVYRMPSFLSPLCKHLLSGILRVNPRDRMTIEEIINHPWWTKTERWVPPSIAQPINPTQIAATDVKQHLNNAARQMWLDKNKKAQDEVKTCPKCGKSMRPRLDNKGMIVLSTNTNQQDDSLCQCMNKATKSPTSPEDDAPVDPQLLMQMPKLFDEDMDATSNKKVPQAVDLQTIQKATMLFDSAVNDIKKTVASQREFDLMSAIDVGDMQKVQQILYHRTCPLFAEAFAEQAGEDHPADKTPEKIPDKNQKPDDKKDKKNAKDKKNDKVDKKDDSQAPDTSNYLPQIPPGKCMCPNNEHRLDLRVGGMDGWTPLHYAARRGYANVVDMLLISCLPLDVNAVTRNNWTPLMFAADKGHIAVVDALLNYRADIHVSSNDGKTAIFLARERNFSEISTKLTQESSVRYMRDLQLNSHANAYSGMDSYALQDELFNACERGDSQKLQTLWPLSAQARGQGAALQQNGQPQQVEEEAKVDFLGKGMDNWTVMHYAARRGHTAEILYILTQLYKALGPQPVINLINSPTRNGWTPLMLAADRGHIAVSKLLIECGASMVHKAPRTGEALDNVLQFYKDPQHLEIAQFSKDTSALRQQQGWE